VLACSEGPTLYSRSLPWDTFAANGMTIVISSRTQRVWFLSTLATASCAVVILGGWLLWSTIYEHWKVRPLVDMLKIAAIEGDVQTDSDVRDRLLEIGEPAVHALINLLHDPNIDARCAACLALSDFLSENIESRASGDDKFHAANLVDSQQPIIHALIEASRDENEEVRREACRVLDKPGREVDAAVARLTEALNDDVAGVREAAARSLCAIGPAGRSAFPILCELLRDVNSGVRLEALKSLRSLNAPLNRELVTTIVELMENDNGYAFRHWGSRVLEEFDVETAAIALIRMFGDEHKDVRDWAVAAVRRIGVQGNNARAIAPLLIEALKNDDSRVRTAACETLSTLAPEVGESASLR
jgi:HEAT repeat protein